MEIAGARVVAEAFPCFAHLARTRPSKVVEVRQYCLNALFRFDAFDDDRQIERELEKAVGANMAAWSKAHDSAINGRAGVMLFPQKLDDLAVQRMTVVLVPFTDVNAHENA